MAEAPYEEDAGWNPAAQTVNTPKVTWRNDGQAELLLCNPPAADSWIEEELNGVTMPPVATGPQVGAP